MAGESPPAAKAPQPGDLITAWDNYRRDGDGHFSRRGLQSVLDQRGLAMRTSAPATRSAPVGAVLIVETFAQLAANFYVLPSFNKSPRSVADWFDDQHQRGAYRQDAERLVQGGPRSMGRIRGPGSRKRFEVIERGEIA